MTILIERSAFCRKKLFYGIDVLTSIQWHDKMIDYSRQFEVSRSPVPKKYHNSPQNDDQRPGNLLSSLQHILRYLTVRPETP